MKLATSKHRFEALGTVWWFEAAVNKDVFLAAEAMAGKFEAKYSRFKQDSELSRLNKTGRLENPSAEFVKLLKFAVKAQQQTKGVFNVSVGSVLTKNGYGPSIKSAKFQKEATPGQITISHKLVTLSAGMTIDLGGFGKGWLADDLHTYLSDHNQGSAVLVNAGGDLRLSSSTDMSIPLMMPGNQSEYFAKVNIKSGGLASSSPLLRSWGSHNHLVDSDGQSYKGDVTQVTVYATNAAIADMAATACLLSDDPFQMAITLGVEVLLTKTGGSYAASPQFPLAN